jgi:outer membrane protein assembly factor BamB
MFSEKPVQISLNKLRKFFNPKEIGIEKFNIALKVKKNFANNKSLKLNFENGNYFLDIFESKKKSNFNKKQKLEYIDIWKNKAPTKIWSINTSNKILSNSSSKSSFLKSQTSPRICGDKLIYARPDGIIGAVDYKTGKKIWYKQYGNINAGSIRGFYCGYEKHLDIHMVILPTGAGVYCIRVSDGSLITQRCGGKKMGEFESKVSPQLFDNIVYIATYKPAGIEAYNFLTGKLIWRRDFEIGKFYFGVGSNPWSNNIIDQKNQLLFVNTGSPGGRYSLGILENYKYSGSLLAINLKKGNIVWQFQEHEKCTWNHDFVGQPILSPIKIKDKDIVITFSKSGSIYFIDRNNGLPVLPIAKETISFGDFKYDYKKSIYPKSLLDTDYYDYLGKNYKNFDSNTTIFGSVPPILKLKRIYDGDSGGPQWPGASIDTLNKYLILPSNHNLITETFLDYVPASPTSLPQNKLVQKCTSCHNNEGGVNFKDRMIIPSLFLTTKIYDSLSLNNYLKNNNFHKKLKFNDQELIDAYEVLNKYDTKLINNNQYKPYALMGYVGVDKKRDVILSNNLTFGKISAISLDTGEIVWQIPAGTFQLKNSEVMIGSRSAGGITDGGNNEGISFFTGSLDKKIYAIRNKDGKYLWSHELPAPGSAPPFVYNTSSERWIFVVASGLIMPPEIIAFKQKLN